MVSEEEEDVDLEEEISSAVEELHRERKKKLKVIEESLRKQLEERGEILAELEKHVVVLRRKPQKENNKQEIA